MDETDDKSNTRGAVGRVPSPGVPEVSSPRRLRRLQRVWPDRDGNISYLLTLCIEGRGRVLNNETTFARMAAFLLESPGRYRWFGRRFVVMPDHLHVIVHMGHGAIRLGQWIKALKTVVGGLERRKTVGAVCGHAAYNVGTQQKAGPVRSRSDHEFTRIKRAWRWQDGYHDHKFRTPESEAKNGNMYV